MDNKKKLDKLSDFVCNMSDADKRNSSFKLFNIHFQKYLSEIENLENSTKKSKDLSIKKAKARAILRTTNYLKNYFSYTEYPEKTNLEKYNEFLYDLLFPLLKTEGELYEIGKFLHGLILFGSSRNDAIEAVAYWLGKSPKTIKDAHVLFRDSEWAKGLEKHNNFIEIEGSRIILYLDEIDKPFPENYAKASPAYNKLYEACLDEYLEPSYDF